MTGGLIDALLARSARERRLLAVLCGIVLPAALAAGLVLPMLERRALAETRLQETRALAAWVEARAAEMRALAQRDATGPRGPVGTAAIEQSLVAARLRDTVAALGADADGTVTLRFDAVAFQPLADWLSGVHPGWGYRFDTVGIEATVEPGMVSARIRLESADE